MHYHTFIAVIQCTVIVKINGLQIMQFKLKGGVIVSCIQTFNFVMEYMYISLFCDELD